MNTKFKYMFSAAALLLSLCGAVIMRRIGERIPLVNELTIGMKQKN